ncbi:uncharacterized protein LOC100905583 [Galendromus occidentalis]|uniref:Uncharacterized protein LOC100905583 n=1 Tax=Galendromus occidentalis TaxID=34638 RepID=A0AAJ6VYY2_9ACAR|nr:uncharacterized protein LOC100905583 [Galendromus occidentalis]
MRAELLLGFALLGILSQHRVEPLASESSFNNRFRRCQPEFMNQQMGQDLKRVAGQVIPTGMTMHSFISTVERWERKFMKPGIAARDSALALLHWFALPDFVLRDKRPEQPYIARMRYELVRRVFNNEFSRVSNWDLDNNLENDDLDDQCFLLRALSHTYEDVCPQNNTSNGRLPLGQNGQEDPFGNNQQDSAQQQQQRFQSNLNNQRQRGSPLGGFNANRNSNNNFNTYNNNNNNYNNNNNNNNNYNPQMPNRQAAVPNLRNSQAHLLSFSRNNKQNCALKEEGVVSITGLREDAVAIGPVLMGIAASKMQYSGRDQWNPSDNFDDQGGSNIEANPLYLATLGQEIGMAAYYSLAEDLERGSSYANKYEYDVTGNWEFPGCLLAYYLNTKQSVAFSRAQMSGAIDGAILGSLLNKQNFDGLTLAELLRLYYSNNFVKADAQFASVCNRASLYGTLDSTAIAQQALLVAEHLVGKDALADYGGQTSSYVSRVIGRIEADLSPEYKPELCPRNNLEQCSGQADLHVILDASSQVVDVRRRQANILGRIVNGMDFRERRNTVHVYSGYSGNGLRKYPENFSFQSQKQNDTFGFTASGCPACLAHHMEPNFDGRSERELFIALNRTLNDLKSSSKPLSKEPASAGRVVLYFRMSGQPIEDAAAAGDALISLRIAHPEVKIIGIGDEASLKQINDRSGGLPYFDESALDSELRSSRRDPMDSHFEQIKRAICETPINLQNVECGYNNNFNNVNNGNNNNNNNNNRFRTGGTNREFSSGVNPRRVQFVSYDSHYFSGSDQFTVQFKTASAGNIKVCDLSADYEYANPGQGLSNPNNVNNNNNVNSNNINNNYDPNRFCFQTSSSLRSITYNYTRRCYDGPRSCAALRYAVVGLDSTSRPTQNCRAPFCESPVSAVYSVQPEGMRCASSSTLASIALIVTCLIAAFRQA